MRFSNSIFTILILVSSISAAPVVSDVGQCIVTSDFCKTAKSIFSTCTTTCSDSASLQSCICADINAVVFGGYFHNLVECLACLEGFLPGTTNTFPGDAHPHLTIETAVTTYCGLEIPDTTEFLATGDTLTLSTKAPVDLWALEWIGIQST